MKGGASRTTREVRELVRVLFSSGGDWTDVGQVAKGVAKDNWGRLALGVLSLVLAVGLAAALVPAVQEGLKLGFYTAVAGAIAWGMWESGFWDVDEGT